MVQNQDAAYLIVERSVRPKKWSKEIGIWSQSPSQSFLKGEAAAAASNIGELTQHHLSCDQTLT